MKRRLWLLAGCLLALAVQAQTPVQLPPPSPPADRAAIAQQRADVQARFKLEEAECNTRFRVFDCLNGAQARQRVANAALRQQEIVLGQAERQRKHQEQQEIAAQKAQALQARQAAQAPAASPAGGASPAVREPKTGTAQQRVNERQAEFAKKQQQKQNEAAERQRQAERRARKTQERQEQAERRRLQRQAQQAQPGKMPAPLPLPADRP